MPKILSVQTYSPPFRYSQDAIAPYVRKMFKGSFQSIDRMIRVFENDHIKNRAFSVPLEWYDKGCSYEEKNDLYIKLATDYGAIAIERCLQSSPHLESPVPYKEIDAIFFISSTGLSTPSIEARIMNRLPFRRETKRVPIWGLGCAGGASGLSRAYDFCLAYPMAKVLVLSVELCSLTFQPNDFSKSNLVGTSLFSDGVGCALVVGDEVETSNISKLQTIPVIQATNSSLLSNSEDVMGWEVKDEGLHVVFSRDIPHIVKDWLHPIVVSFLKKHNLMINDITQFVAHPGGKKVIESYHNSLKLPLSSTEITEKVLRDNGNMSSATILFVLKEFMETSIPHGDHGLITALGPGFSSELLLVQWH